MVTELPGDAAPFDFLTVTPARPLGRFVETIWYARGTVPYTREKIAPTGSTVAVFVLGDPILQVPANGSGLSILTDRGFLLGPHDEPTINEPKGETFAVGVVATPIGCEAVFDVRPGTVRGRVVDLVGAWPAAAAIRERLAAMTDPAAEADPSALLALVEGELAVSLDPSVVGIERCERAVELLEADPTRPIGRLATSLGVSHGQLDRDFTRVVGLSPRVLARLLRMRRLLQSIDVRGEIGWSDRAAELGWFDQAHLIRDFKRHTGVTPSEYLAAQRTSYTTVEPGDAAGFVPEA